MEWKPIETAPEDEWMLLSSENNVDMGLVRDGIALGLEFGYSKIPATHWMPLPKPVRGRMSEEEKITAFQEDMASGFVSLAEQALEKHGFLEISDAGRLITQNGVAAMERFLVCTLAAHIFSDVIKCKKKQLEEIFKRVMEIIDEQFKIDNA